jgi:hypothetical protein
VRFLSVKDNCMSFYPLGAEHNAKRKLHIFENRALLDVQFQISSSIAAFCASITDPIDIDAAVPKSILQTNSVTVRANTIHSDSMSTGKRRRPEEASAKTRALLISPIDQPNRNGWLAMKILRETAQHLKTAKNTQAAI